MVAYTSFFHFAFLTRMYRPKHRNLVLSDFVEACIEENTLLNEAGELTFQCFCRHLTQVIELRLHALIITTPVQMTRLVSHKLADVPLPRERDKIHSVRFTGNMRECSGDE